jgi:NADH:ubiquinone oxidoreductase subunit F (NADH-binding)
MMNVIESIERGEKVKENTELLHSIAKEMQNKCLCPLGEFATMAVTTAIERFPADFIASEKGGSHG